MSGDLTIRFAHDVPAMAVDVVAPDLQVIERVMLSPGREETVPVPSEWSFLRAHLPSGETVIVGERGTLERTITREMIEDALGPRRGERGSTTRAGSRSTLDGRRELRGYHRFRATVPEGAGEEVDDLRVGNEAGSGAVARLLDPYGDPVRGRVVAMLGDVEWSVPGPPFERPFELHLLRPDGGEVRMRVPGNATRVWARSDVLPREGTRVYSVRVQTDMAVADTIMNYLGRGDVSAAETMRGWAARSERLLQSKMQDPYSAAVGAYLLLRLQAFEQMHDWSRNLANSFEFPDGCVIWAWQLIHTEPSREDEIASYLLKAAERGVPVYAEGLRLLLDGLKLLGDAGRQAHARLRAQVGAVVRESPLSMWVHAGSSRAADALPVTYDVSFGVPS